MTQDIRWQQRLNNYKRALALLNEAVELGQTRALSDLEKQGLIQAFEFTHELAWNCLKDFLTFKGQQDMFGSRDATRKAFELGLIEDGETWMDMIVSRNRTSHTYNKATAEQIVGKITTNYAPRFKELALRLAALASE